MLTILGVCIRTNNTNIYIYRERGRVCIVGTCRNYVAKVAHTEKKTRREKNTTSIIHKHTTKILIIILVVVSCQYASLLYVVFFMRCSDVV